jgi:Tol biopolymer transport system component
VKLAAVLLAGLVLAAAAGADPTFRSPSYLAVSPDGTQIAWADGSTNQIWVAAPDGSDAHAVAPAPTGEGISDLHWTPLGLVVDSNFELYLVRPHGHARLLSAENGGFDFAAGGTRVATGLERAPGAYVVTDVVTGEQWRYGSPRSQNHWGALSPDGTRVAWTTSGGIRIARLGQAAHRLAAAASCPTWSPDGKSIAFMRLDDLRVISANGGPSRLVAANVGGCQEKAWSPDSATIAYAGPRGVILVDARSGRVGRLPKALGQTFFPAWSADGSGLYVSSEPASDAGAACLNVVRVQQPSVRASIVFRGCP